MKALFFCLFFIFGLFLSFPSLAIAIEDPLTVPNNKIGIHILFPEELPEAATLVNSSGGDWGYVTIPIQGVDRNLEKWQAFMDVARSFHLIPIIRLATEGNYFNTAVWRRPTEEDVLDFANFLNSLDWPTKNRYVVVFNEVNRADEWQGEVNPAEYAQILSYAAEVFKSLSPDFFIISAGLDNAAATVPGQSQDQFSYFLGMNEAVPGIFDQIDGLGSHSYPNPGFSQPPTVRTQKSIASFSFEKNYISRFTLKNLPVFITETGWSQNKIPDSKVSSFYKEAFASIWADQSIIAITPFLLRAGSDPFAQFSFLDKNQGPTGQYSAIKELPKIKGDPVLTNTAPPPENPKLAIARLRKFASVTPKPSVFSIETPNIKALLKWFLKF